MKVTRHGSNLTQMTKLSFVNCYFVHEDDGLTLIDTAIKGCGPEIMQVARQLGQPIVRITLTHVHADHIGALDELHEALPEAEVLITARGARFIKGDMSLDADEAQTKLNGGWVITKTAPTRLLHEGDRIGSLEVIASPGHAPDHIAFLDTRDRTMIAGDAYQTMSGIAVSGTFKLLFPLVAMATWHQPTAIKSARKLRALEPERLAVGHGRVLNQPLAAMDSAIEEAVRKLGQPEEGALTAGRA